MSTPSKDLLDRLGEIRRRLNRRAVLRHASLASATVLLALAALVWIALRSSPQAFLVGLYGGIAAAIALFSLTAWSLHRRWLSLDDTARLVDRRSHLKDRVRTALWLSRLHPAPRLGTAVLADAVFHAVDWSPAEILPRRSTRIFLLPAAALALLLAAIGLIPPLPPEPPGIARAKPEMHRFAASRPLGRDGEESGRARGSGMDGPQRLSGASGSGHDPQKSQAQRADARPSDASPPIPGLGSLPSGLRDTIRRARGHEDGADSNENPQQLARGDLRPERTGDGAHVPQGEPSQTGQPEASQRAEDGRHSEDGTKRKAGRGDLAGSQKMPGGKSAADGRGRSPGKTGGNQKGERRSSSEAGGGSSPETLFAKKGPNGEPSDLYGKPSEAQAKAFRLTLSSFLRPHDGDRAPRSAEHAGVSAGSTEHPQDEPNEEQIGDDAVRRAQVPAEYEDVVRRVYSAPGE